MTELTAKLYEQFAMADLPAACLADRQGVPAQAGATIRKNLPAEAGTCLRADTHRQAAQAGRHWPSDSKTPMTNFNLS